MRVMPLSWKPTPKRGVRRAVGRVIWVENRSVPVSSSVRSPCTISGKPISLYSKPSLVQATPTAGVSQVTQPPREKFSGSETCGMEYDDSYRVYLEDESYGTVRIDYEQTIESYLVRASFTKTGQTRLVLESPEGEKAVYELRIERYSYEVRRLE